MVLLFMIAILIMSPVSAIDSCAEFRTYESCILSQDNQCLWDEGYCQYTKNLELGCSSMLNKMACVKQLSFPSGQFAKCVFEKFCQQVKDLSLLKCTDQLSKYACLQINDVDQLCYWNQMNYTCNSVVEETYQDDFQDMLYSVSVCSRINDYLIIHSSLLWSLISYTPDFASEAQDIYRIDFGLTKLTADKIYDSGTLANNKLYTLCNPPNEATYFEWYHLNDASNYDIKYLKISDRQREGCIAVQIESDDDYQVIFNQKINSIGVNQIYCRYQGGVFTNYQCLYYDTELKLTDEDYLAQNQIVCSQLSSYQCSFVSQNCYPIMKNGKNDQQLACVSSLDDLQRQQGCLSSIQVYQTYVDCTSITTSSVGVFLDLTQSPPQCDSSCVQKQQSDCNLNICKWVQSETDFYGCIPNYGCEQPGVNQYYCMYMAQLCNWDNIKQKCHNLFDYQLNILKCNETISKYSCASIRTMGQECLWIDEDNVCLNVLAVPFFKKFESFPEKYVVNRILCMNSKLTSIYKNFKCIQSQETQSSDSELLNQFNKALCLSTNNCYWDIMSQQCQKFSVANTCQEMINISSDACSYFLDCVYDSINFRCISQSTNINCDSPGLSKQKCLTLNNYPCQWINNQCQQVTSFSEFCGAYNLVTLKVCILQSTEKCYYENKKCKLLYEQPNDCSNTYNRYSCQFSSGSCYFFNNQCQTYINQQVNCEGYYLTQKACVQVITKGQECMWDQDYLQCKFVDKKLTCVTSDLYQMNKWACVGIKSDTSAYLDRQYFCQYDTTTNLCQNQTYLSGQTIDACGDPTILFNQHICNAQTKGNCIFENYQCNSINTDDKYWYDKLGTIKCEQANYQLCLKVRGRVCQWIDRVIGNETDRRCGEVTLYNISCVKDDNFADQNTKYPRSFYFIATYNSQVCANIQYYSYYQRCKRNSANNECEIASNTSYYNCNELGINKVICLMTTYGQCAFVNSICINAQNSLLDCQLLNQWACINAQNTCVLSSDYALNKDYTTAIITDTICQSQAKSPTLVCAEINFNYLLHSWTNCSVIDGCYGRLGQCVQLTLGATPITKCDSPGVSKQVCLNSVMYCQFKQGLCQSVQKRKCEFESSIEDCAQNQYYNCVYQNGKCYTQNLQVQCNQYEYTNFKFCRQYNNCRYDFNSSNCIDLSVFVDIQNNYINYSNQDCTKFQNQFDCLNQWKTSCLFQSGTCLNPTVLPTSCPHLQQYSKIICQQFENCNFQYNYYCYDTTQTITCSNLTQNLCLSDINDSLQCFWDGTNCNDVTNQTCSQIKNYLTNYSGCLKVSNQDNQKCLYSNLYQKCKLVDEGNQCTDFTTNIECALRANASCILGNPASATTSCSASSTYNINLNQYGCAQLTGSAYYYDIYTYTCQNIDLKKIQGCQNLNKVACLQSTSDALVIQCGWLNNRCQQLLDLTSITDCTILNKYACINIEISTLACQWNVASKTCTVSAQNACYVPTYIPSSPTILYSLSLCSKSSNVNGCMANYNQSGCSVFNYQVTVCSGIGMNQKACIEFTTGQCIWQNNYCQETQLDNQVCTSSVNKNACLLINNQLCTWNDSSKTCSDIVLVDCSDATNYNQCMNVPDKLCEYVDICQDLILPPIRCKQGYNKLACQNVKFETCQFIDNSCSIIQFNNYWQICAQYTSSDTCPVGTCEWQDNKCIQITQCDNQSNYNQVDLPLNLNHCEKLQPAACIQIYNKYSCIYSSLFCQWDDVLGCSSFVTPLLNIECDSSLKLNQKVCDKFAPQFCQFKEDSCTSQISQYYFDKYPNTSLASQTLGDHDADSLNCDQYLDQQNCLWSTKYECFWHVTCQQIDDNTITLSDNLNLPGCIRYNYQWRERKCFSDTFKFQPNPIIEIVNDCETPYISMETCLNIKTEACYYDQLINQCKKVIGFDDVCNAYFNVNKKTCQLLTNYDCDYNPTSKTCISFTISTNDQDAISRKACTSQSIAAYWNDGCHIAENFQCDTGYQCTPQACALALTPCAYDRFNGICSSVFNVNQFTCDSPGLNFDVCASIVREPCIFQDQKCQKMDLNLSCGQAIRVNALACSSISSSCKYDAVNKKCIAVEISQLCSTQGLSKSACNLNDSCLFNNDLFQCECSVVAQPQPCHLLTNKTCITNSICYFDQDKNICRRKICEDLKKQQCGGTLLDKLCYMNLTTCQSAAKCEDIINVNANFCETILFDGIPCLGTGNRCFTWNNYDDYCPNSNCSSAFCKLDENKVCKPIKCQELNQCSDLGNKCIKLLDGTCQENNSCYLLDQDSCSGATVSTQAQCYYQKYNIYTDDVVCTSQVCQLFGNSDLCDGNQYNGYTCLLVNDKCQPCEQIKDVCKCAESLGTCVWNQDQCRSFLCQELETQGACAVFSRCLWSEQNNQCLIHCNKIISADDCNKRTGECYYDEATNFCKSGVYQIPSLTVEVTITSVYGINYSILILVLNLLY